MSDHTFLVYTKCMYVRNIDVAFLYDCFYWILNLIFYWNKHDVNGSKMSDLDRNIDSSFLPEN
jgi:hypothetical protein